jgi:predicted nuclease with TOPRIM domain
VERVQQEIDRLRTAVHDLRARVAVLEITKNTHEATLKRLEEKVDALARKDEIEEAIRSANRETRVRFWHTWQGGLTTAVAVVVLAGSSITIWDRLF